MKTPLSDEPPLVLQWIVQEYPEIWTHPSRLGALLSDLLDNRRATTLLVAAAEEGIPTQIRDLQARGADDFTTRSRLCAILVERRAIDPEWARWTIELWASALVWESPERDPLRDQGDASRHGARRTSPENSSVNANHSESSSAGSRLRAGGPCPCGSGEFYSHCHGSRPAKVGQSDANSARERHTAPRTDDATTETGHVKVSKPSPSPGTSNGSPKGRSIDFFNNFGLPTGIVLSLLLLVSIMVAWIGGEEAYGAIQWLGTLAVGALGGLAICAASEWLTFEADFNLEWAIDPRRSWTSRIVSLVLAGIDALLFLGGAAGLLVASYGIALNGLLPNIG